MIERYKGRQIDPRILQGIGRIAVSWSECEHMFIDIIARVASFDVKNARLAFLDTPPSTLIDTLKSIAAEGPDADLLLNYAAYFDVCRQNRNRYVHSYLLTEGGTRSRRSAKIRPLPDELLNIERTANDIDELWQFGVEILRWLNASQDGEESVAPPEKRNRPGNLSQTGGDR